MTGMRQVTPHEAHTLMTESGALLLDVREQDEWDEARIPGSVHKPMSTFQDWYDTLPGDRTIVVHCHSGGRSERVVAALLKHTDLSDVANLDGGIADWEESNLPIDTESTT